MAVVTPDPAERSFQVRAGTGITQGDNGLAVWTDQSASRCTLTLRGRLSAQTVGDLDRHVDLLLCRWCDEVVIEVSGLSEIDAVGARLIVGFGHYVRARGGRFGVNGASAEVEAILAAADLDLAS